MTTIGSRNSGVVLQTPTYSNPILVTGPVINPTSNERAIFGSGIAWTITNQGVIENSATVGANSGIQLLNGGDLTNANTGLIEALSGDGADGFTNVANYGSIIGGPAGFGIQGGDGGTLTNAANALISGGYQGVGNGATFVSNAGIIRATAANGTALALTPTNGFLTNAAQIAGGYTGISFSHAATVINTGTVAGTTGRGVFINAGGLVSNAAGKSIIGANAGVMTFLYGAGTVTNAGTITATATSGIGVSIRDGGSIFNSGTGIIQGGADGADGATDLTNYGTIIGTTRYAAQYGAGGTWRNAANAVISGAGGIHSAATFVSNAGLIRATAVNLDGVHLTGTSGTVTNSATIAAGYDGVRFDHAGTVVNTGTIAGAGNNGVFVDAGGYVGNGSGNSIAGGNFGVNFFIYGAGTLTNAGTIAAIAAGGIGVDLRAGGNIGNASTGLIQGSTGVVLYGTASTLRNFGTIVGSGGVSVRDGGNNDRVIAEPGAVFDGTLVAAPGNGNTLELAAGIGGALTASGFGMLQFDPGAQWTVAGGAGGLSGTVNGFAAGDAFDLQNFVAVSDTFTANGLVLTDGNGNHVTLAIKGNFVTGDFSVAADNLGTGTLVGLGPPAAHQSPPALGDFGWAQGWGSVDNPRAVADVNGDGTADYIGFGFAAAFVAYGATFSDAQGAIGPGFSGAVASVNDFGSFEGYTADVQRGAADAGVGSGDILYGQGFAGVFWYEATGAAPQTDAAGNAYQQLTYQTSPNFYGNFGSQQGWSPQNGFQILKTTNTDAAASILGFGDSGIVVGPDAFAPGATANDSYVLDFQGGASATSNAGNNFGWNQQNDIRTFTDANGKTLDLNHDGIADFVGMGPQGLAFAFGNDAGPNGAYSLGPLTQANIGPVDLGDDQGWNDQSTLRYVVADPQTGFDDILAFGYAGVYVAMGQDPATHGGQPFGQLNLAMNDFGAAQGWSVDAAPCRRCQRRRHPGHRRFRVQQHLCRVGVARPERQSAIRDRS